MNEQLVLELWAPWVAALALLYAALGRSAMNYSALTFAGVAFIYAGVVAWGAGGVEHLGTVTCTVGIYLSLEGVFGVRDAKRKADAPNEARDT